MASQVHPLFRGFDSHRRAPCFLSCHQRPPLCLFPSPIFLPYHRDREQGEALMAKFSYRVRPETAILTRGFDPQLSVGSARPPVYRSSTYVFSSPEAAERAFSIVLGKARPAETEVPDLIYARLNHPNAEILEDQLVPLERGASAAAVFNSGMAAILSVMLA